jgi:hypothetical protein
MAPSTPYGSDFYKTGDRNMKKKEEMANRETDKIASAVLRLNVKILGVTLALLLGLAVFIATNWLIIKGGEPVGPHLQLLSQYFIGYRVTFWGSLIGFAYGFALGGVFGVLLGWIYNGIVMLKKGGQDPGYVP